ncbi:MAG TPA: hypothetical protein VH023_02895 [Rhodopila sp.]|jgi:hypothetical protein|nr:hypothetical protein [Rhodopila sp.]
MTKAFIGAAVAGLILAGCSMPQQPATTTASAAPTGQNCKKLVQDTGSKIIERRTVCDNGPGGDALRDSLRLGNQASGVTGK